MASDAVLATLILGGMCVLMWWLARLARKRMGVGAGTVSSAGLRVVGKRPLDQRSSLFVVEIAGGRHILLGSGMDGTVTKLDDISLDEFAAMTAGDARAAEPRLRVAPAPIDRPVEGDLDAAAQDGRTSEDEIPTGDDAAAQQQFATVGESFTHFLSKAKDARTARRDRRASGE